MKKYILLLFLFFVYIILSINNNKTTLVSIQNSNISVDVLDIEFVKGINSNNLKNIFEKYKYDYLLNGFKIKKISIVTYKKEFTRLLKDNDVSYIIK